MYHVLVTGNGFDIEHKIPSSYKQFLEFVKVFVDFYKYRNETFNVLQKENIFTNKIKNISLNYKEILSVLKYGDEIDKECLEELYKCTYNNTWITYFQQCLKKRKAYGKEYNWVDIEEEIADVMRLLEKHKQKYGTSYQAGDV